MGEMLTIKDLLEKQNKQHQDRIDIINTYEPMIRIATEYGLRFSKTAKHNYSDKHRAANMTFSLELGSINCLSLNLYLSKEDSIIKDVGPIIEDLKEHPRLKFIANNDYIECHWKGWEFRIDPSKNGHPKLLVRAWFKSADKCKLVGTGEFKEVMKVECEE